jgi:hypothetical protein
MKVGSGSNPVALSSSRERPECWENLAFSAARANCGVGWFAGLPDSRGR